MVGLEGQTAPGSPRHEDHGDRPRQWYFLGAVAGYQCPPCTKGKIATRIPSNSRERFTSRNATTYTEPFHLGFNEEELLLTQFVPEETTWIRSHYYSIPEMIAYFCGDM